MLRLHLLDLKLFLHFGLFKVLLLKEFVSFCKLFVQERELGFKGVDFLGKFQLCRLARRVVKGTVIGEMSSLGIELFLEGADLLKFIVKLDFELGDFGLGLLELGFEGIDGVFE